MTESTIEVPSAGRPSLGYAANSDQKRWSIAGDCRLTDEVVQLMNTNVGIQDEIDVMHLLLNARTA